MFMLNTTYKRNHQDIEIGHLKIDNKFKKRVKRNI